MTPRSARGGRACCAYHAMMMWPAGMAASGGQTPDDGASYPSFVDGTVQQATDHVRCGDSSTHDLFERVERGRLLVVRGGTVLPMTGGAVLPDHDVITCDGVIQAVRPTSHAPDGAVVVDAAGKYVIPGLSDMHTHPILEGGLRSFSGMLGLQPDDIRMPCDLLMFLYLAAGVTRTEVMMGSAEELALREEVRAGRIHGPRMTIASPLIEGNPPMHSPGFCWLVEDAEGGRKAARMIAEGGFDFAKPYSRLKREPFAALANECRELGIPIMGHIPLDVGPEVAIDLGQTGVAHVFELFRNGPPETRGADERLAQLARLAAGHGVTVQTTITAGFLLEYDAGHRAIDPLVCEYLDPVLRYLLHEESPFIKYMRADPDTVDAGRDAGALCVRMAQALIAEGVRILPATDMPGSNWTQGYCLHEELRVLVDEVGMSPHDAIRAATWDCAEYHEEGAIAGTLERGKLGDLVVLDRNPLKDIGATRQIDSVVIAGAVLRREAIERGVARANALYAAMPVPEPGAQTAGSAEE